MRGLIGGKLFLGGKPWPIAAEYARAALSSYIECSIARLGVDYQDLIGPGDGPASLADVRFLVKSDNGDGDLQPNTKLSLLTRKRYYTHIVGPQRCRSGALKISERFVVIGLRAQFRITGVR